MKYRDKVVRVEVNGSSSGDEFSDIEETEEQRILRESGAQIVEDDDDDDDDDIAQAADIQSQNQTRDSVIQTPIDRSGGGTVASTVASSVRSKMKPGLNAVESDGLRSRSPAGRTFSAAPKPDVATQKKKESKLEASIRKISDIREKACLSETAQKPTASGSARVTQPESILQNVPKRADVAVQDGDSASNVNDSGEKKLNFDCGRTTSPPPPREQIAMSGICGYS